MQLPLTSPASGYLSMTANVWKLQARYQSTASWQAVSPCNNVFPNHYDSPRGCEEVSLGECFFIRSIEQENEVIHKTEWQEILQLRSQYRKLCGDTLPNIGRLPLYKFNWIEMM